MRNIIVAATAAMVLFFSVGLMTTACGPTDDFPDAGDESNDGATTAKTCDDFTGVGCNGTGVRCEGDLLVYCENSSQVCEDCAGYNAGGPLHCGVHNIHGPECMVGSGQPCDETFPAGSGELCDGTCTGGTCQ